MVEFIHFLFDVSFYILISNIFLVGCPYYAAWTMAENAQLVFCPYSYIVNPVIRAGVEVDLKGAIIIFDEAQ